MLFLMGKKNESKSSHSGYTLARSLDASLDTQAKEDLAKKSKEKKKKKRRKKKIPTVWQNEEILGFFNIDRGALDCNE